MCTLPIRAAAAALLLLAAAAVRATTYEVGPGLSYTSIGAVPWESLVAGDIVRIHARPTPYAEKWVICAQGTEAQPIQVIGVPDGSGQRPIITGESATTRSQLAFWGEERSLIKIGGASTPSCDTPAWIVLEGLQLRRARNTYTFTNAAGSAGTAYSQNASALFIETGHDITIRNCVLEDSGIGLFSAWATERLLIEGNLIQGNGVSGSVYQHNAYTAGRGVTYRGNRFRPLCSGCPGNNLKDRSAGTVIEANWIEGGNRQLDLVEGDDNVAITSDARYGDTFVAGNVLFENGNDGSRQVVHFGGDNGVTSLYRPRLWFWNNTVVSTRTDNTVLMRLETAAQQAHLHDNIIWASAGGGQLALLDDSGGQVWMASNWLSSGWSGAGGTITDSGGNLTGTAPGFVDAAAQNFHLTAASPCRDAAGPLPAQTATAPLEVIYVEHQQTASRLGQVPTDLGAFWDGTNAPTGGGGGGGGGGTTPPATTPPASSSGCGCGQGSAPAGIAGILLLLGLRRGTPRSRYSAASRS